MQYFGHSGHSFNHYLIRYHFLGHADPAKDSLSGDPNMGGAARFSFDFDFIGGYFVDYLIWDLGLISVAPKHHQHPN